MADGVTFAGLKKRRRATRRVRRAVSSAASTEQRGVRVVRGAADRRHLLAVLAPGDGPGARLPVHRRGRPGRAGRRGGRSAPRPATSSCSAIRSSCRRSRRACIPASSGCSVLEHLLGDAATVAAGPRPVPGALVAHASGRLPASSRISRYDGRLTARQAASASASGRPAAEPAPACVICPSSIVGNAQQSPEEARVDRRAGASAARRRHVHRPRRPDAAADRGRTSWSSRRTTCRCAACGSSCRPDVEVGTVDKFQGREAPVVFFSMASSSGDDVPRGAGVPVQPQPVQRRDLAREVRWRWWSAARGCSSRAAARWSRCGWSTPCAGSWRRLNPAGRWQAADGSGSFCTSGYNPPPVTQGTADSPPPLSGGLPANSMALP